ncbi:MAG: dicarboxylate/amino acid:cation symporter, partial [Rhodospirillales bacterium]
HTVTTQIFIAMIAGLIVGILFHFIIPHVPFVKDYVVDGLLNMIGAIFVAALKMLVVPLVFVSLVCGVTSLADIRAVGRIGGKSIVFYLLTTAIAITIALMLAVVVSPGEGIKAEELAKTVTVKEAPSFMQVVINMVPQNPVAALAQGEMLQIIVFSIIFGLAITLAGARGQKISEIFDSANEIVMKMVVIVMKLAPYGVFCLIAKTFSQLGFDIILPLAKYFFLVIAALAIHASLVYGSLFKIFTGLNPLTFYRKMRTPQLFAFSTASSNATIPVNLETAEYRLGASNKVASFTIPLGATINMDGTAIMQGVATVFLANVYAVNLGLGDYVAIVLTATLASIGTAGVPGVGLIMLAMVLRQVGIPVEGIALIVGVDRLLDMLRTAVNITGDAAVTCIVAKSEKELDLEIFNDPAAGEIRSDP